MRQLQLPIHALSRVQKQVLGKIVSERHPDLLSTLDNIGLVPLEENHRLELQNILMDEFLQVGLDSNDEPNEIGIQLEDLIDVLSHL